MIKPMEENLGHFPCDAISTHYDLSWYELCGNLHVQFVRQNLLHMPYNSLNVADFMNGLSGGTETAVKFTSSMP